MSWAGWMMALLPALGLATPEADEVDQLKTQRKHLQQSFDARLQDCYQRFNVNDCLQKVKSERSAALQPVIKRQRELEQQLRQEKADARQAKILNRQQARSARQTESTPASDDSTSAHPRQP